MPPGGLQPGPRLRSTDRRCRGERAAGAGEHRRTDRTARRSVGRTNNRVALRPDRVARLGSSPAGRRGLIQAWHGRQEARRVRVLGSSQDGRGRTDFDDPAGVDDRCAVREARHDAEVVGDEQDREAGGRPKVPQQFQDAGLHRHVQRGGGLVRDEQRRVATQGHRDHHPLAHPTAELVGILVDSPAGICDAHPREELHGPGSCGCPIEALVCLDRLRHLGPDRQDRVEAREGILEHDRDTRAADLAELAGWHAQQVGSLEPHRSLDVPTTLAKQAHDRQRGQGLARP